MGTKKPTRIVTPRIVQPGEGSVRPWLWLLFLVALAAWSLQVFEFGRQRAGFDVGLRDDRETALQKRVLELEEERDALRASAARFERSGQIDRAAADGVQAEVRALQGERAELKREVTLLKTLVTGGEKAMLALSEVTIKDLGDRKFHFEAMLSKGTDDQEPVSGQVSLAVGGKLDGEDQIIDMPQLTDGKRSNIGIRFKSFQKLKAELQLPKGFDPASIRLTISPEGKKYKTIEQTYDWDAAED